MAYSLTDEVVLQNVYRLVQLGYKMRQVAIEMQCTPKQAMEMEEVAFEKWGRGRPKLGRPFIPDLEKKPIERVKGVYSNPQWHELYKDEL